MSTLLAIKEAPLYNPRFIPIDHPLPAVIQSSWLPLGSGMIASCV